MLIVNNLEDLAVALGLVQSASVLAYDIETTGLNPRKDLIMGIGVSTDLYGFYIPIRHYLPKTDGLVRSFISTEQITLVLKCLQEKKLLMFNASFDGRFTKFEFGIDLVPSLYADVLLLKHTCDEDFPLDLKGIAKKLYGEDATKEKEEMQASIKSNGGTAKQYYKASTKTLATYCVKDCLLTFKIFNHYLQDLRRQKLEAFYFDDEVMPLYKHVTIPMEEAGVRMDVKRMGTVLADIKRDISALERTIQESISDKLDLFTTWFLNKDFPLQTFTGKQPAWAKKHPTQLEAWQSQQAPGAFMFNLQSKHHLKKLFFDTLKLKPISTTPTGQPRCDEEFLDSIKADYPWVQKLIEYNSLNKIKSTYIERFLNEIEDGNRFYASFMQHRTVSGRYSGDLQQLPRPLEETEASPLVVKYTNCIREFVLPSVDNLLCSADYEQLEPTVFSHLSGDKALQDIFNKGLDFYSEIAIRTEGLMGASSDKKSADYLGKLNKVRRQNAKAYALGIPYGLTGYKLQFEIGVTQERGDTLVADYLRAFPDLAKWMNASRDEVCFSGKIRSQAGRIRHMPRAQKLFKAHGIRLLDSLALWKEYHERPDTYAEMKKLRKEFSNYLNNAVNFQVQSLAASIMNRAAIQLAKKLKELNLQSRIVMQVHDQLVLDCPLHEIQIIKPLFQNILENIVKLSVPLRAEPVVGENFQKCK